MHRVESATRLPWTPVAAVALTIVTWGIVSPLLKYASLEAPALSFYRLWIGAAVLLVVYAARGRSLGWQTLRWGVPAGILFGGNLLCFVFSVKLTTVANATLIGALQPAIVLSVAGPMFGERVSRREVACVALAIVGVAVVIVGSAGAPEWNPLGDFVALLAVLSFTVYFLVSKQARTNVATLDYMLIVHFAAALVVTPVALANPSELVAFNVSDVFIVAFFALVSGTAGQVIVGWAHRFVDVSLSSLMMLGVPVIAAVTAWLMLGESLGPAQITGGAITLVAIGSMLYRPAPADVRWKPGASTAAPVDP